MDVSELNIERKKQKLSINELATRANLPKGTVEKVLFGIVKNPRIDTMQAIERALGISQDHASKFDEIELNDLYAVPLLGSVVAGVPIEAQENLEGYVYISYRPKEEYFALRVHGNSMKNANITDKSVIICHKQEIAESGDIVVAMLNNEQTVKRYKIHGDNVFLMPENPDYMPIPITPKDELIILGKVVEVRVSF